MKSSNDRNHAPNLAYPRTGKRGVPQQFPRRLYEMLEAETTPRSSTVGSNQMRETRSIIEWSESGRAFRIGDVSLFAAHVLPKYFRTSKFSSFQRNLNLYGFTKVRRGPDTDMYAHPSFLRGYPQTLSQLRKSTSSASSSRKATSNSQLSSSNSSSSSSISEHSFASKSPSTKVMISQFMKSSQAISASPPSPKHVSQVHHSDSSGLPQSSKPLLCREITLNSDVQQHRDSEQVETSQSMSNINQSFCNRRYPDVPMVEGSGCYPRGGKLALLTIALTAIGDCEL